MEIPRAVQVTAMCKHLPVHGQLQFMPAPHTCVIVGNNARGRPSIRHTRRYGRTESGCSSGVPSPLPTENGACAQQ